MELVERDDILRALSQHLVGATQRRGAVVLLRGEAGIGKSAVVSRFAVEVRDRARLLIGSCDPLSSPRPLGPLVDMAAEWSPTLHEAIQGTIAGRAEVGTVFGRLLTNLQNAAMPTLIVFEDVHWADGATYDLLRFLIRRLESSPTLLVATYRDDEVGPDHPLIGFRHQLARMAVLAAIPSYRRIRLHKQVLEALRRSDNDAKDLTRMTYHAHEAGDEAAILQHAPLAARRAFALGAHREAAAQYELAIRHADALADEDRAELLENRAHACYLTGQIAESSANWEAAGELRHRLGDPVREGDSLRWRSYMLWLLSRNHDARAGRAALPHGWSDLDLPAVDEVLGTGDERTLRPGKESGKRCDLLGTAHALQW